MNDSIKSFIVKDLTSQYGKFVSNKQFEFACGFLAAHTRVMELLSRDSLFVAQVVRSREIVTDRGMIVLDEETILASYCNFSDGEGLFEDEEGFGIEIFHRGRWYRAQNIDFK